jgi:hypothetical protein
VRLKGREEDGGGGHAGLTTTAAADRPKLAHAVGGRIALTGNRVEQASLFGAER